MTSEAPADAVTIDNIAISLSGGGVRAFGFHLGMFEMLDRLELLGRVRVLSTVSGGSLTGTGYAMAQHYGQTFNRYFGNVFDFLPTLNTLELLLEGMTSRKTPAPSGRRDLITVLANIYDDAYFRRYFPEHGSDDSPRFGLFWEKPHERAHLREIIFNATEFQTGTAFRFQKSDYRCLIGNANISLCREHAGQIRMADVMAASSCIPVGMEPLFFPDDFHWPDDTGYGHAAERPTCDAIKDELRRNLSVKFRLHHDTRVDYFALMDGGVYDNQGIVSLLLAMNRLVSKVPPDPETRCTCGRSLLTGGEQPGPEAWARWIAGKSDDGSADHDASLGDEGWREIDLLIISDTPVRKDSFYPKLSAATRDPDEAIDVLPAQKRDRERRWWTRVTVGRVDAVGFGVTVLLLASASLTAWEEFTEPGIDWTSVVSLADEVLQVGIPLLVTIALALSLFFLRKRARDLSEQLYAVLPKSRWGRHHPWWYVKRLSLGDLFDMLNLRIGSTSALTGSIFMNRIRALSYSAAYSRDALDEHAITNEIFALEHPGGGRPPDWPDDWPDTVAPLGEVAAAIVTLAAHMRTKLWNNRLDKGDPDYAASLTANDSVSRATRTVLAFNAERASAGLDELTDLDVLVVSGELTTCYKNHGARVEAQSASPGVRARARVVERAAGGSCVAAR